MIKEFLKNLTKPLKGLIGFLYNIVSGGELDRMKKLEKENEKLKKENERLLNEIEETKKENHRIKQQLLKFFEEEEMEDRKEKQSKQWVIYVTGYLGNKKTEEEIILTDEKELEEFLLNPYGFLKEKTNAKWIVDYEVIEK